MFIELFRESDCLKVARLQSELGAKYFLSYEFSYEQCSEMFPNIFEPLCLGWGQPCNIPAKFPAEPPREKYKNSPTSFCRSTGRRFSLQVQLLVRNYCSQGFARASFKAWYFLSMLTPNSQELSPALWSWLPCTDPISGIYIYIYGPHLISWADILHFWHVSPSFIVKNTPILQPTNCGCKFVFLFSSSSLLLPFSALFFFFLCFYQSQSLKFAHQLRCAAIWPTYICRS